MALPIASPAASRRMARTYPSTVVAELTKIEQQLGGRTELVGMLALAPLTPDLRYVLGLLGDPQYKDSTLAEICGLGNILPGDLLKHLSSAAMLKGKLLASQAIGEGIAAVAKDVMRKAAPYEDACHRCAGTGSITADPTTETPNPRPEPCLTCVGTGRLVYQPELDRQRLAIDMAQLVPKGGGIQIANINGAGDVGGKGGGSGSLEVLQQLTDKILYGSGDPLRPPVATPQGPGDVADAELVDVPDGAEPEAGHGATAE